MFHTLINISNWFISKLPKYQPLLSGEVRTGTKIAVYVVCFNCLIISWLLVGIPILTIYYPVLSVYAQHLSSIIVALIGGVTAVHSVTEVRKTVENIKSVQRNVE